MTLSHRLYFPFVAGICIALLAYGYYLEYFQDLVPCPMCIFQRLCYMAVAVTALIGTIAAPARTGSFIITGIVGVFSTIGAGIAGRQTWLQHLPPDQVPECGPDLAFMLEMYPFLETVKRALIGTGDCAAVAWTFLGLSIAEWSLICFVGLVTSALWRLVTNR
ncbi:MAG: disulfide bond formation protein DsbB [Gammaproteobacteria bacterium]|jgi:disulfide bond formation protein DsbB